MKRLHLLVHTSVARIEVQINICGDGHVVIVAKYGEAQIMNSKRYAQRQRQLPKQSLSPQHGDGILAFIVMILTQTIEDATVHYTPTE